jgi:hypothetical protein
MKYTKSELTWVIAFMVTYFGFSFAAIYIPAVSPYYDKGKYAILVGFLIANLIYNRVMRGAFFPRWQDRANRPPFFESPQWKTFKFMTAWVLFLLVVFLAVDQWTKRKPPVQWPEPDPNVNILPSSQPSRPPN